MADPQPAQRDGPMIEGRGLSKSFDGGRTRAVAGVDLVVARRAFHVVVGESGSGKTTLIKMLNRLVEPDAGTLKLDGRPVADGPAPLLRRKIGYVFQGVGLFPHLTVEENIGITPRLLGWPAARRAERARALMELVGLPPDMLGRAPDALSGGQRQRVGLARGLAAEPELVLLDEPFGALDAVTRDRLGRDYRALHDRLGLTTVMITHDMLEALLLGDRIGVMKGGRMLAEAAPADLMARPGDAYVHALLDTPRRQADAVAALAGKRPPAPAGDARV